MIGSVSSLMLSLSSLVSELSRADDMNHIAFHFILCSGKAQRAWELSVARLFGRTHCKTFRLCAFLVGIS